MQNVFQRKKDIIQKYIQESDTVLDIGFWGQAVKIESSDWPHRLLKKQAKEVYGVDLTYDESKLENPDHYRKQSGENFDFDLAFDVIFAGDIIEHFSNPGLFLDACTRNIKENGRLIITTPNAFNLFNIAEKMIKKEPAVNPDHTFYFNITVLRKLLEKNGWKIEQYAFLDDSESKFAVSIKRRVLQVAYKFFGLLTPKFTETLVVVAKKA